MVGLERLWHSGVIPRDWDAAAFGGSGDMVSAQKKYIVVAPIQYYATSGNNIHHFGPQARLVAYYDVNVLAMYRLF